MFGYKKILKAMLENQKIIARESVNRNEFLAQQNALMVIQNDHLRNLAQATRKIDEFNRIVYSAQSGYEIPDADNKKEMLDFQNTQGEEREAVNDLYYSDMSVHGSPIFDDEG